MSANSSPLTRTQTIIKPFSSPDVSFWCFSFHANTVTAAISRNKTVTEDSMTTSRHGDSSQRLRLESLFRDLQLACIDLKLVSIDLWLAQMLKLWCMLFLWQFVIAWNKNSKHLQHLSCSAEQYLTNVIRFNFQLNCSHTAHVQLGPYCPWLADKHWAICRM